MSVKDLHDHGLLPETHVHGLRLQRVYVAHRHSRAKKRKWRWA